ncbi:MAG: DUF3347 domain-containing protein [Sediminicola sp.]
MMKSVHKIRLAAIMSVLVFVGGCKDTKPVEKQGAEQNDLSAVQDRSAATFKDVNVKEIFHHYIHIKTALVNGDSEEAASGAAMLAEVASGQDIRDSAKSISAGTDIGEQRAAFASLTTSMEHLLSNALRSGEIYKQHCPMAFNNKGASWLSMEKEIKNPYFGEKMLSCGSITETIR